MTYTSIIFLQNAGEYDRDGVPLDDVARFMDDTGETDESAMVTHLAQWDFGEGGEEYGNPPWGRYDDTFREGEYVLSWNRSLGHLGLCRIERVNA